MVPNPKNVGQLTEHLFRETYQEVFSTLVVKFGRNHIDLIEDALQEAFYKALKSWRYDNHPKNPKGWLYVVTKNHLSNELKQRAKSNRFNAADYEMAGTSLKIKEEDQLILLLACARLDIHPITKLVFTLKAICGFGVSEIAQSLQISEPAIYKQLQRGRKRLKGLPAMHFDSSWPIKFDMKDRSYIEGIIYFMFNQGYDSFSSDSDQAINKDICFEAVRLAHLLAKFSKAESSQHLLALFYFHMARFSSRVSKTGEFISLRNQDRSTWDKDLINIGFSYLLKPSALNRFYIEALIASNHLRAKNFSRTDWETILTLYDQLLVVNDSAIVQMNRAICLYELNRNAEATKKLNSLRKTLENSYLYFPLSMAEYLEAKDPYRSKVWYRKSLGKTKQDFRKRIIKGKLNNL